MEITSVSREVEIEENQMKDIFSQQRDKAFRLRSEPYGDRTYRLKKLRKWIFDNRSSIQQAVYSDFRKPAFEADLSESFVALADLNLTLRNLKKWTSPKRVPSGLLFFGTSSFVHYEPKGVCLIISPWNYPFNLAVGPLISALAAGNTAIIKPSEMTPHTSRLLKRMVSEVFPPNEVAVFEGGAEVSEALLKLPFNHIFFTGSTEVGKIVMAAASRHLASVTLELGGKSPVIIDETADLEDAAEKIAWGKLLNCGQTCVSPDYVFVHRNSSSRFLELLQLKMASLFDPEKKGFANSDAYARIVSEKHYHRLTQLFNDAIKNGATLIYGGQRDESQNFIGPVIFAEVPEEAKLMKEEIFGPLLPVNTFDDHEEVLTYINKRPKPLSLYVFSKSRRINDLYRKRTSSGSACVNDVVLQFQHPNLPFGGINESGMGKSHGHHGFLAFSNEKSWLKQRRGLTGAKMLYPPYTPFKQKLLNVLMRYF